MHTHNEALIAIRNLQENQLPTPCMTRLNNTSLYTLYILISAPGYSHFNIKASAKDDSVLMAESCYRYYDYMQPDSHFLLGARRTLAASQKRRLDRMSATKITAFTCKSLLSALHA